MTDVNGALTQDGGEAEHILTIDEMPSHNHTFYRIDWYVPSTMFPDGAGSGLGAHPTTNAGGDQPHNNLHPYFAITYIVYVGRQLTP